MDMKRSALLVIDAAINLTLGLVLLLSRTGLSEALGLPAAKSAFYPSMLGAVLIGIGLALLLERFRGIVRMPGLGLGGAIGINICGGALLIGWLVGGGLSIPMRGTVILWVVAVVVLGVSVVEVTAQLLGAKPEGGGINNEVQGP